jgi:hypothetical protein
MIIKKDQKVIRHVKNFLGTAVIRRINRQGTEENVSDDVSEAPLDAALMCEFYVALCG